MMQPASSHRLWMAAVAGCATPWLARAHTEAASSGGFAAGLLHPLTGGDHLLAMVAVGVWGAILQAPLVWVLPVVFPLLMVTGAVAALAGLPLVGLEPGVALSVLVLGGAIAAAWRAAVPAALAVVGFFGFLHGYAHGAELPSSAEPAAYAAGFVLASGLLHAVGIGLGTVRAWTHGLATLRCAGLGIAAVGAALVVHRLAT